MNQYQNIELTELLTSLCKIPAPSHQEQQRAAFIQNWLLQECGLESTIDSACNVIVSLRKEESMSPTSSYTVFMAHTDTVFPDLTVMPVELKDSCLFSPGVGDDTACAAILMMLLKYYKEDYQKSNRSCLFVFNSCEEGLGNLKGCRQLHKDYENRIDSVTSFDGGVRGICNKAVGSVRYRVAIRTRGGHSFNDFGQPNAILLSGELMGMLSQIQMPSYEKTGKCGKNTWNIGTIQGGTSVNTIPQSCEFLCEYRSDTRSDLLEMQHFFQDTLTSFTEKHPDAAIDSKCVGDRPCGIDVDPTKLQEMTDLAKKVLSEYTDIDPVIGSGSTDCNIPLSLGIPAICFGGLLGDGVHTREEYVRLSSVYAMADAMDAYIREILES